MPVTESWVSPLGFGHARTPFPAAVACRRTRRLLCCVRDHSGQQLAYVYFEDEPGRRSVVSS
jgi:hypothetical protein